MPSVPVKVPSVGESITEGILAHWMKADGESVKEGESLFELETDKASCSLSCAEFGGIEDRRCRRRYRRDRRDHRHD